MSGERPPQPKPVKGPMSYFPSIEKTYGRPVEEWFGLIQERPGLKHAELVAWLKEAHGMGHGHANALVAHVLRRQLNEAAGS
jgi:Domain of unknown function (DUF4287)